MSTRAELVLRRIPAHCDIHENEKADNCPWLDGSRAAPLVSEVYTGKSIRNTIYEILWRRENITGMP